MEIMKLKPAFKDYLWGGTKLKQFYNKHCDLDIVAESWEVSTHKDGPSVITDGKYAGKTLPAYLQEVGNDVLGTKGKSFEDFPMLIKFIDAKGNLSIQVHPDNEYARRVEHEYGKTEMWYILEADEGASLYFGTSKEVTREEFKAKIEDNTVLDVLKQVPVHKGDVFFIEAGTIHAIGEGIVICEIQQNSNSTYRVYDFGRVGADGKPRELHIEKALDVSNLKPLESDFKPCGKTEKHDTYDVTMLGTCDYFTTYLYNVKDTCEIHVDEESFAAIIILDGKGTMENDQTFEKGDSFFVPAGYGKVKIKGNCQFILARV